MISFYPKRSKIAIFGQKNGRFSICNTKMRHFIAHMSKSEEIMSSSNRDQEILRLVNTKGSVSIKDLAKATYASPSTIRRDLEKLEQKGLLRRHHGGAESVLLFNPPRVVRKQHNQAEKNAVAQKAAALITPNSTIFIDASNSPAYAALPRWH